jgi:hypothetical protein
MNMGPSLAILTLYSTLFSTTAQPTPKKIVVEKPKSGGSGAAGGILFLLVIAGVAWFLTQTDVGKQLFDEGGKWCQFFFSKPAAAEKRN